RPSAASWTREPQRSIHPPCDFWLEPPCAAITAGGHYFERTGPCTDLSSRHSFSPSEARCDATPRNPGRVAGVLSWARVSGHRLTSAPYIQRASFSVCKKNPPPYAAAEEKLDRGRDNLRTSATSRV